MRFGWLALAAGLLLAGSAAAREPGFYPGDWDPQGDRAAFLAKFKPQIDQIIAVRADESALGCLGRPALACVAALSRVTAVETEVDSATISRQFDGFSALRRLRLVGEGDEAFLFLKLAADGTVSGAEINFDTPNRATSLKPVSDLFERLRLPKVIGVLLAPACGETGAAEVTAALDAMMKAQGVKVIDRPAAKATRFCGRPVKLEVHQENEAQINSAEYATLTIGAPK